jgi:basic amino acid/polyamine antiporter, APA family
VLMIIIVLMLSGRIDQLATATVLLLLSVFAVVNVALVVLKRRAGEPTGGFEVPVAVPVLGAIICLTMLAARVRGLKADDQGLWIAGIIVVIAAVLYVVLHPTRVLGQTVESD